ncbi:MAG: hypothetical protein QM747_14625 [Nocardioides sp.]
MRTRTPVLLAIALTVGAVWLVGLVRGGGSADPVRAAAVDPLARPRPARALRVLHRWDRARAAAWRRGDPRALARLYVAGSAAGRRDVHELSRWSRRGLRVTRLRQQVSEVRVVAVDGSRVVVLVSERTLGGIAVGPPGRARLPSSAWARHRILFRRQGRVWRVVDAQPAR